MTIHRLTALELKAALDRRELSSVEIVDALIRRREAVEPIVNAFVDRFDAAARKEAEKADAARARGESLGALHGLPITIKESMAITGTPSTLGIASRKAILEPRDAVTVELLKREGAIVLGKTNVPMLLLSHESNNPIWGRTVNPWNRTKSPGGSSGGESAAIAAGSSPWGVGTDLGGSIRVPAAYTGIAGLKPTNDRWSNVRSYTALVGQEVIRGQCGPMARTAADVAYLFTAIDSPKHCALDPAGLAIATRAPDSVPLRGMRVGLILDDGFVSPSAAVRRAVERSAALLSSLGVEVVPFTPPRASELMELYYGALSSDGGRTAKGRVGDDPITPELRELLKAIKIPNALRPAVAALLERKGEGRIARLIRVLREKPVDVYWQLTGRRSALRLEVFDAMKAAGVSALLGPVHATPPMSHGDSADFVAAGSYSMYFNFLNFPAGTVPITRVRPDEVRRETSGRPTDRIEKKAVIVDAGSAGLPVGVQIAGLPNQDDVVLALMVALEGAARGDADFPTTPVDPT
ncbi:MAG: amidase [Myxococcales bacterium]|nr:amidase [Myxococcales bacterium]